MKAKIVFKYLADPSLYIKEIELLNVKLRAQTAVIDFEYDGLSFADIYLHREKVARALASDLSNNRYDFGFGRLATISLGNKSRTLMRFNICTRIVHGVLARKLSTILVDTVHPRVFSYQTGKSWYEASLAAGRYVRHHRNSLLDVRSRGLYVLRRDIKSYVDEIPTDDQSKLWTMLLELLNSRNPFGGSAEHACALLRQIIRPIIKEDGGIIQNSAGIPMGSPIANPIYNLYALPLDKLLGDISKSFYARYCDDFIFMHPDAVVVKRYGEAIKETLASLGLRMSLKKAKNFYFNGAGRPSEIWPEAAGTTMIPFVGVRISFTGEIILGKRKLRKILRGLRARLYRTYRLVAALPEEQQGKALVKVVNDSLQLHSSMALRNSEYLLGIMTSRNHLRELDYRIARDLAQIIGKKRGARAFRRVPIRTIRRSWGLQSLVVKRNRVQQRLE